MDNYRLDTISSSDVTLRYTDSGLIGPDGSRLTVVRDADDNVRELIGPTASTLCIATTVRIN